MTENKAAAILEDIVLGPVQTYKNLCWVPVHGPDKFPSAFLTVDQAIETGHFIARESGKIPHIHVANYLDEMVFIASGMILEGNTQNRASIYPVLVPPHSDILRLPVHCAEERQDLIQDGHFGKVKTILIACARSGTIHQDRAWSAINATMTSFAQQSQTHDYASLVRQTDLRDYIVAMGTPDHDQRGYVAAVREGDSIFFYADIFGNHSTFESLHVMLYESIAAVAKQHEGRPCEVNSHSFRGFLDALSKGYWKQERLDHGFAGQIYVTDRPVEGTYLEYRKLPVQLSLRKDMFSSHAGDTDPKKTMFFVADKN